MGLKSTLKLFLFFCSLNLILNLEEVTLGPDTPVNITSEKATQYAIKIEGELKDYITIKLELEENKDGTDPVIVVGTDSFCGNRITMTDQKVGPIYIFLQKSQVVDSNPFYICTYNRGTVQNLQKHRIEITTDDKAELPLNQQTSFYVDDKNTEMTINFIQGDGNPSFLTFWARGKNLKQETRMSGYPETNINGGKIFYGIYKYVSLDMFIASSKGDYVTVGSASISSDKTVDQNLNINGNEITIGIDNQQEVCFPIDFDYQFSAITGKLYTLKGITYFKNLDGKILEYADGKEYKTEVIDGIISDYNDIRKSIGIEKGYYCVSSSNPIIFTIQMVSFDEHIIVTPPTLPGDIRRYIMKEGDIAIFSAMTPTDEAKKLNFNMKSLKGFPEMYFDKYDYFPIIKYIDDKFVNKINPLILNRFATYIYHLEGETEKTTYLSQNQPIIYIHCPEGSSSKFVKTTKFCEIEISIFTNQDTVDLAETRQFSQYLDEGEANNYKIIFPKDFRFNGKIFIELTPFTGDAEIIINNYYSGKYSNYYLSNKVFCNISYDRNEIDSVEFTVKAKKKVFYTVDYYMTYYPKESDDKTSLESGINYITSKDAYDKNKKKLVNLKNFKYEDKYPYMASFYSPNCELYVSLEIDGVKEEVSHYDNYAHIIMDLNDNNDFCRENYQFTYNIEKDDGSNYPNKFCMVYVAGLELDYVLEWKGRSISLSEGVPHIFPYTSKSIYSHYSYYILNQDNSVVMNFNLIDKAYYKVYLRINRDDIDFVYNLYKNQQISLNSGEIKGRCSDFEICKLDIILEAQDVKEKEEKKVEISVYQLDQNPIYLEKNRVKNDFINGNAVKHYYFDISKKEYGDITLDFKRGSGNIYAIVESRTKSAPIIVDADWRGVYKFPDENTVGTLEYRTYGKKLLINEYDTYKCDEGCYVLITVKSNREIPLDADDSKYPFRISLNPRVIPKDLEKDNPIVKISLNEFVIGDIFWANTENRKYDFYQVELTHDSNEVIIDFQSDTSYLLVNVGKDNPPRLNEMSDWFFPPVGDFVYRLGRAEMLEHDGRQQTDSIKGIILTIGVYANVTDSIKSTPYAFRVYEPPFAPFDNLKLASELIHVTSDQKVQCLPMLYESRYPLCLFAILFDDIENLKKNLILLPRSQNNKPFEKYGRKIEALTIETYDVNKILELTKDTYENAGKFQKTDDYIFEENVSKDDAYFLIISTDDSYGVIDLLSSTYAFENGATFRPNPSTAQIFALQDKNINILFQTHQDLLLNINSVNGVGFFNWVEEDEEKQRKMYLKGRNDRLSLTSGKGGQTDPLPKLQATSRTVELGAGFVFYITYYPRSYMDQLKPNTMGEIHYRTVKMPLSFFAHIGYMQPWIVNLNFYEIIPKNKNRLEYELELFDIWGTVLSENDIYKARNDELLRPNPIPDKKVPGKFDAFYGVIFFSEDEILRLIDNSTGIVPYIYFNIDDNIDVEYETIGLEADVHSLDLNGESTVPEGVYITGKLKSVTEGKKVYRIKINKNKPFIRIEYSTNSVFVKFALSADSSSLTTDNFEMKTLTEASGRNILTVKLSNQYLKDYKVLYFIAFSENSIDGLDYFLFKYLSAYYENEYLPIKDITNSKIKVDEIIDDSAKTKKLKVTLNPVPYNDTKYLIKAIYTDNYIRGENIESISMSESKGKNLLVNVHIYEEGEQSFEFEAPYEKDILYVKVMAMFNFVEEKIIYLYKPYDVSEGRTAPQITLKQTPQIQNITLRSRFRIIVGEMDSETVALKKQKYQVIFENPELTLEYVKVEVTNLDDEDDNLNSSPDSPTVCISSEDPDCMYHRNQLSRGGSKSTEIFVKREQFSDHFFFTIECHDSANNCSYRVKISKQHEVTFDHLGIVNYYVAEENRNMVFKFNNNNEGETGIISIYATGGKDVELNFANCNDEYDCSPRKFSYGAGITAKMTTKLDNFLIRVSASTGDYISLGVKYFKQNENENNQFKLYQKTGQITGILREDIHTEECYDLPEEVDTFYLTGRNYDNSSVIKFTDIYKSEEYPLDIHKLENGFFYAILNTTREASHLCFNMSKNRDYSAYSIQIQSLSNFNGAVFLPQNTPLSYPRIIPKGKVITLNSILPKATSKYLVYNMIARLGYPKMFIYDCDTYPSCPVDETDIESNPKIKRISDINGMSSYFTSDALHTPIDAGQKLLVFKCNDAPGKGKDGYDYCEILSTIFGDNEPVKLFENQPFARFNTPDDTNQYLIDLTSVTQKSFKIFIDFLVVSGDVKIGIKNSDTYGDIDNDKYYLSNKIFYSIKVDRDENINADLEKIAIDTNSKINSYYLVQYKLITDKKELENTNYIRAGFNYLVPIEEKNIKKYIDIESIKIIEPKIFIASFYSLNCKFEIEKISKEGISTKINSFGRYAQDFYEYQEADEVMTKHSYSATIINKQSLYHNDMCMLYVSGVELYDDNSGIRKEILVSEGVPQRMIFVEQITKIRYVFPHAEPNQNLTCSINMIVPGKIRIKMFFREKEHNIDKVFTQSGIFFIYDRYIQDYCEENYERCSITVELEKLENFNNEPPIVEFTIKKEKNTPYYFPRGIQRKDYITNDAYLFIYTDVGKEDTGYITFDFDRGSGYAYGKIVKTYQTEGIDDADWRDYKFIRNQGEQSLEYDYYNKKIKFYADDTKECDNGCFILISVVSSVYRDDNPPYNFQTFSILAAFNPETGLLRGQNKIEISPDEFVIGSFYKTYLSGEYYKEDYSLTCPYDAEAIEIDWQSNIVKLIVVIEGKEFEYSNKGHSLYTITKDDIFGSTEGTSNSIKNKELVLKVSTTEFEAFEFSIYSFRIHFKRNKEINIHKVTSDKKIVCTPTLVEGTNNTYRCLFIVIYREQELFSDLMIYHKSQDPSALINAYADFINSDIYDSYNIDQLKDKIPAHGTAKYDTIESKTNFLFLKYGDFNSHALVSVISDNDKDIELLTSFKTFERLIEPNPRSPQVYSLDLMSKNIHINFVTKKSLSITITSLHGEARYSFDHDEEISFYLRGEGDKLNYAINAGNQEEPSTALNVENLRYSDLTYKEPGCAFVLEFSLRSSLVELDSIRIGETKEMVYKDLPFNTDVYYYAKITDTDKDIAGFFYLHDLEYEKQSSESRLIYSGEILFKAMVVTEKRINDIIDGDDKIPDDFYLEGIYDATLKAGSIQVGKSNFTNIDNPVLLVAIRKDEKSNLGFKRFRGEIGFNYVNGEAPVTQKLYQFGKIENPEDVISYKLKTDSKTSNYVRVQFSGNSEFVDFAISEEKGVKINGTFNETSIKRQRGITFVTFLRPEYAEFLYLNVFLKNDSENKKLNNYVFKYMNALEKENFIEFKMMYNNPRIEVKNINGTIKVLFSPINYEPSTENDLDTNILYSVKLVPNNTYIKGERTDLIAITESPSVAKQFKHISTDNRTVEIISDIGDGGYEYAQVIAAITHGSFIEYVTYQAVDNEGNVIEPESNPDPGEDPDDTSEKSDDKKTDGQTTDKPAPDKNKKALIAIIVVSCFLFVVVVVLIVVIVMYNSKNKDLLTQVNKISFVQSGASAKDDANLLLDNQNELD